MSGHCPDTLMGNALNVRADRLPPRVPDSRALGGRLRWPGGGLFPLRFVLSTPLSKLTNWPQFDRDSRILHAVRGDALDLLGVLRVLYLSISLCLAPCLSLLFISLSLCLGPGSVCV